MQSVMSEPLPPQYNVLDPAPHTLYQCRNAAQFRDHFAATAGIDVEQVTDGLIARETPKALFSVGSIPLGMGTRGSDIDLIVLVDSKDELLGRALSAANDSQRAAFLNEADALVAGSFMQLHNGVLVDVQVAIAPAIRAVYERLRRRSPELGEMEVRILGRLRTGWLLGESDGYLQRNSINMNDRTLPIYCCTRNYVTALTHQRKAAKALELGDALLALQLGRASAEMAYLAYFASEGLVYLGVKWLAQLGFGRDAHERINRCPILKQGLHLLFPPFGATQEQAAHHLEAVGEFVVAMRGIIEKQLPFRIAFQACVQIAAS